MKIRPGIILTLTALILLVGTGICFYLVFSGPHMLNQPNLRTFEKAVPNPPPLSVPMNPEDQTLDREALKAMRNPLPSGRSEVSRGRHYYEYYCLPCHGEKGDGEGPVGQSYVPAVTNLVKANLARLTDGELLIASLTGVGHSPVLEYAVQPAHRWYLVTYLRRLNSRKGN